MEKRRIQTTGGASFTITLPKKWINRFRLKKNDIAEVTENQYGTLIIRPTNGNRKIISTIQIDYLPPTHIIREVTSAYLAGVEEIHIQARSITYEQRSLVRSISYKLIGFEQFTSTSSLIVLKNVSNSTITPAEYIDKMFSIIASMYEDLIKAIKEHDISLAHDIIDRDIEVDRIHLMIIRTFINLLYTIIPHQNTELSLFDIHYYEHIGIRLERIADHIVKAANTLLHHSKPAFNKFEWHTLRELYDHIQSCKEIVLHSDKRNAHKLLDELETTERKTGNKHFSKTQRHEIIISNSMERITGYIMNITEETLNYLAVKHIYN